MTEQTEADVFEKLVPLICEVTGARSEQVRMDSGLMEDLGAESIDLLDLSFLIEETFGVALETDEFERHAADRTGDAQVDRDGTLTPAALEALKQALPEVPAEKFRADLKKIEVPGVLNVAVFVHLIQRKRAGAGLEVGHA